MDDEHTHGSVSSSYASMVVASTHKPVLGSPPRSRASSLPDNNIHCSIKAPHKSRHRKGPKTNQPNSNKKRRNNFSNRNHHHANSFDSSPTWNQMSNDKISQGGSFPQKIGHRNAKNNNHNSVSKKMFEQRGHEQQRGCAPHELQGMDYNEIIRSRTSNI